MKPKLFTICLLVIFVASSWLVINAVAQDQPPAEKERDLSELPGGSCSPLASGGPDTFGYTYRDSFQLDGPEYQWVELSSGTAITLTDDEHIGPFPIGFPFDFYGTDYSQFYIQSNGVINFLDEYLTLSNDCPLPVPNTHNNLIALMWDDLDPGDTNDPVYYHTFPVGGCPYNGYAGACLVVQYDDFCLYPGGASCDKAGTFETILFDNHDILIQYLDAGVEKGSSSTTGIENADGSDGLTYGCNTIGSLSDGRAILFDYPGPSLTGSRLTASTIVELGDDMDYSFEIANSGNLPAAGVVLTDVLPAGTTFVPGSLACSSGTCWYDGVDRAVYWNGRLDLAQALGFRPTPGKLLTPQNTSRQPQAVSDDLTGQAHPLLPAFFPPGTVIENFDNTWGNTAMGLVYNPSLDQVRYAHEVTTVSIWDVDYPGPHAALGSYLLSALNPGWPVSLNPRNGIDYDPLANSYFLPDYAGDLINANDNIIEIAPNGTILNAWELSDNLGSNDSYDDSSLSGIIDIAIVPGTPPRYFVTVSDGGNTVYEIDLIKTGTWWTPNTWGLLGSCSVPGLGDNVGIDYDAEHGLLYHSDWASTNIVATDLACHTVITTTCASPNGFNTGITYIEGKSQPEIWVTDYASASTTRCAVAGGPPCEQSATLFSDDFENGLGNWSMNGLWNQEQETDTCGATAAPFPSSDTGAYFGQEGVCTYSTGARITGTLALAMDIDLTGYSYASLNFMSYEDTECTTYCNWDQRYVDVSTDGGLTWATIWAGTGPEQAWYQASANLMDYVGGPVRVRFRFDSFDGINNGYFGWLVDNIKIVGCPTPVELTFSVETPAWCGPVANQAVLTDPQAQPVTLTAVTQVVEDLYQAWDFEIDDGGFERSLPGEWEWGVPTYPAGLRAHSGDKVWGTDLHGDADDTLGEHRLEQSVTLPNNPKGVFLDWWDWNGAEASDYIRIYIGGILVYEKYDYDQRAWTHHVLDVSSWAGMTVDIEFVLDVAGSNPGPDGWYIDDLSISTRCTADAQVNPLALAARACTGCTATSAFTLCDIDNLPLKWRVWENAASLVSADVSAQPGLVPSLSEPGPHSGAQVQGVAEINQSSLAAGKACRVAVTADDGSGPNEAIQLHATLTELGFDWVDVTSVQAARDAGANVLIDRYAGLNPTTGEINAWLEEALGYVQLGDWPDWFATSWEEKPDSTPLTITVVDSTHPLAAGLPSSWIGLGFWSYDWDEDAVGWVSDPTYANIMSARYTTPRDRAASAVLHGLGRAVYLGFNTYGTLAGVNDKRVLRNAITWSGNCTEIPWLAETPSEGGVLPGACRQVTVTFDATGLAPANYFANLVIHSNDFSTPLITLPVTFTVTLDQAYLPLVGRGP